MVIRRTENNMQLALTSPLMGPMTSSSHLSSFLGSEGLLQLRIWFLDSRLQPHYITYSVYIFKNFIICRR